MEIDIKIIKELSEKNEDENWEFRAFLKASDMSLKRMDRMVHGLYEEFSSEIDCTSCANCCREIRVALDNEDIENFSNGLGISPVKLRTQYLIEREESGEFSFKKKPCPFLEDNLCTNYHYRPKGCGSYPHLHKEDFIFRLIGVVQNYSVCPIVFNVYESLKDEIWHKKRKFRKAF